MTPDLRRGLPLAGGILLLVLAACQSAQPTKEPAPAQAEPTPPPAAAPAAGPALIAPDGRSHVAVLVPMSGPSEAVGRALLNAAQMALFDLGGGELALDVYDTQGTPQGAFAALQAATRDGAALALGPLFAGSARGIKAEAAASGLPVLSFSSDETVAGDGLYTLGISPALQVQRVVDFAARLGVRDYGALVPRTAYGDAALAALQQAATQNGATLVKAVSYTPGGADLSPEVRELAVAAAKSGGLAEQRRQYLSGSATQPVSGTGTGGGTPAGAAAAGSAAGGFTPAGQNVGGFEALLLPAGGSELINLAALLPYYDIDPQNVQFLGMQSWADTGLAREPALVGGWFAAPEPGAWEVFSRRYASLYGEAPPRLASLGYDAMAVAAVTLGNARSAGESRVERGRLENPAGFAGVDGIFRLQADGTLQRGLAVLELRPDGLVVRDAAPQAFAEPQVSLLTN